jgi:hypothetical protein
MAKNQNLWLIGGLVVLAAQVRHQRSPRGKKAWEGAETYDVPGRPKAGNLDLIFLCHRGRLVEDLRNSLFHFSMGAKVMWTRIIQPMINPTTNPPMK